MIRKIHCQDCRDSLQLHSLDVRAGWKLRRVIIEKSKIPPNHTVTISSLSEDVPTKVIPLTQLVCDQCNAEIPIGTRSYASTMWLNTREGEPGNWEAEFTES